MKTKISVILPTYNESMNIVEMVERVLKSVNNVEVIVSDDDSPDKTWEVVKEKKWKNVRVIRRFKNKGVGPAIWAGIQHARGDIIVWLDADLTMPPEMIPKMLRVLETHDVVVGSRYVKGGGDKRALSRVVTSRMINLFSNLVLNFKVLDYDSGFVATHRSVFDQVGFSPKGHGEYCIEFLYMAGKRGFSVKEIPFIFTERTAGESKSAQYFFSIFKYGIVYVLKILSLRFTRVR